VPQSLVSTVEQKVEIADVLDVVYTEPEQDEAANGDYVREIRVYGSPADGQQGQVQVFVLRLRATTKERIQLTTVPLQI
jgi:hypothetical protein